MKNKLYTIGETAQLTGLSVKTIRYYDEVKLVTPKDKSESGYRLYSLEEAHRLQHIMTFRLIGFSINEIRQMITGETDVSHAAQLQLQVLSKQIKSLHRIQVLLEAALEKDLLHSPKIIAQIGEELKMTDQQRQETLVEQFGNVMLREQCSPEWVETVFKNHEDLLNNLTLDTKEKMDAFYSLKNLLADPEFIQITQHSMQDFWNMVNRNQISPTEWELDMGQLYDQAYQNVQDGLTADSPQIQHLVDQWASIISKNINIPVNERFMEIWMEKIKGMYGNKKQKQYYEVLSILDPKSRKVNEATKLLLKGLEYKMKTKLL